mgnify:CR=1 FL=1
MRALAKALIVASSTDTVEMLEKQPKASQKHTNMSLERARKLILSSACDSSPPSAQMVAEPFVRLSSIAGARANISGGVLSELKALRQHQRDRNYRVKMIEGALLLDIVLVTLDAKEWEVIEPGLLSSYL